MTRWQVAVAAIAALVAIAIAGCGSQAVKINATIARAMLEVQAQAGPVIRDARVEAGVNAARSVHDAGGLEADAQLAATAAAARWECAIDGHRFFALAVGSYVDAIVLWQAGTDFELTDTIPFVRRALDAYRVLRACLHSLGSELLPDVPSFLRLIPPTWSDPQ